ncbi:MAG: hypothetical protein OHK0031_02350 [Anaerolineales bacterium]
MKPSPAVFLFAMLLSALLPIFPVQAQGNPPGVQNISVDYDFGQQITFQGQFSSPETISEALIFFRAEGEASTRAARLEISPKGDFSYFYPTTQAPLRAFAKVDFWFSITLKDGNSITTPLFYFTYSDNRFPWQESGSENLTIHWYAGDAAFGQELADTARNGLERINDLLGARPSGKLELYVYASAADLQSALALGGQAWVAGHASPDLGVAMVSIAPDPAQGIQMDRQIPHELAHLTLYQIAGEHYDLLPLWLREGIASSVELSPNPDYEQALKVAAAQNGLLSFNDLCAAFPSDASSRFLAYAQSASLTRAIVNQYGISGLNALIRAYSDGLSCEEGARRALGIGLSQVESGWRATTLGENRLGLALQNLAGYLTLFGLLLLPLLWQRFRP